MACGLTCSTTYKSPDGPPRNPASPFPAERSREPVSTPAGMRSLIFEATSLRPFPWHALQGFSMTRPAPWQCGHVCAMLKIPRELMICPRPPQVGHDLTLDPLSAPVPLHTSHCAGLVMVISFSQPCAASSNAI